MTLSDAMRQIDRERSLFNWRCDNSSFKGAPFLPGGCVDSRPTVHVKIDLRGDGRTVDRLDLCEPCLHVLRRSIKREVQRLRSKGRGMYKMTVTPCHRGNE